MLIEKIVVCGGGGKLKKKKENRRDRRDCREKESLEDFRKVV